MARTVTPNWLAYIKEAEGLYRQAYRCPAGVWTIGYGHTGADVTPGLVIDLATAEALLQRDLAPAAAAVEKALPGLTDGQFDALVSFVFNVGVGAFLESTLLRRIKAGEEATKVISEELPRWIHGGGKVLPGLVARRRREAARAAMPDDTPPTPPTPAVAPHEEIALADFFHHFQDQDQQVEGVHLLQEALAGHPVLSPAHPWVKKYRERRSVEVQQPQELQGVVQLKVPYFYQLDSQVPSQGGRMCFSSVDAMLLEYLKPGSLRGGNGDDQYLQKVREFGDTTDAAAQVKALAAYGVKSRLRHDGTPEIAKALLRQRVPVPIGVLHHGPVHRPIDDGGHWLLLVGFDDTKGEWICHDSYGEMDVANGGYVSNAPIAGRYVRYSYRNLNRRWAPNGPGDVWFIEVQKP